MRSANHEKRRRKFYKRLLWFIGFLLIVCLGVGIGYLYAEQMGESETPSDNPIEEPDEEDENGEDGEPDEEEPTDPDEDPNEEDPEEQFIDIQISAVGDIMMHDTQLVSAYDSETDSYHFNPVFEDIKPFIESADLAIANLETTLAGSEVAYSGYPIFNAPDSILDGIEYAGFDMLITANNHSLDTNVNGLLRTARVVEEAGLHAVGTYESNPEKRYVIEDIEGVKVAVVAYTEMVNFGVGDFTQDELYPMINMMIEDQIVADMQEIQEEDPDLIVAYMHWGAEYQREPNTTQVSFAELLNREGVDIILGSHPHVIQSTDIIESEDQTSFVAYSMGNFVSNQRVETLGNEFAATEDGVILNFDIQKNVETGETTIEQIEAIPTWVYRSEEEPYTYQILPIEQTLDEGDYPEEYLNRMQNSLQETNSRLNIESLEIN